MISRFILLLALFFSFNLYGMDSSISTSSKQEESDLVEKLNGPMIYKIDKFLSCVPESFKKYIFTHMGIQHRRFFTGNEILNMDPPICNPDGSLIAYFTIDDVCIFHIQLQSTTPPYAKRRLDQTAHTDLANALLAFNHDGSILASGEENGTINLWNISTGNLIHSFSAHDRIKSLLFSPNGALLASYTYGGTLNIWDLTSKQCIKTFNHRDQQGEDFNALAFNHDCSIIVCCTSQGVNVWDIHKNSLISSFPINDDSIVKLSFLKNTSFLTGITHKCNIVHWDVKHDIVIPHEYKFHGHAYKRLPLRFRKELSELSQDYKESPLFRNTSSAVCNKDGTLIIYYYSCGLILLNPETKSLQDIDLHGTFDAGLHIEHSLGINDTDSSLIVSSNTWDPAVLDIKSILNFKEYVFDSKKYTWEQLFYVHALLAKIANHYKENKSYTLHDSEERVIFRRLPEPVQNALLKELVKKK